MKKLIVSFLLLFTSMMGIEVLAYDFKVDGIYYRYSNETEVKVTFMADFINNKDAYTGNVVIPESVTHNGTTYSVTSIDVYAFYSCTGLTSVIIPNSITSIQANAFSGCTGLTSVNIPNSVTGIYRDAFYGCSVLTSINIPNSVTFIDISAFYGCNGLTSVIIPNSVTSIGNNAFAYCRNLSSVTIGNSVNSIGESAFRGCSSLTSVIIPNTVTDIWNDVFKACDNLTSIKIPVSDLNSICNNNYVKFYNDKFGKPVLLIDNNGKEIEELIIPEGVASISENAFRGCIGLTSVIIPNSVTSIDNYAFYGCSSLESVTIGSGVLSIGNNIFKCIDNHIPAKVIWLANTPPNGYRNASGRVNYVSNDQYSFGSQTVYKFLGSTFKVNGLIYVPVSIAERTCDIIDCRYDESTININVEETVIYKGVSMKVNQIHPYAFYGNRFVKNLQFDFPGAIPDYAFALCESLEKVTVCDKVTAIGQYAFSSCKTLPLFEIPQSIAEIGNFAFQNCTALKDVYIAERSNILKLGSNGSSPLFSSCPLDSLYIGGNISYSMASNSGYSPFYRNTSLRAVNITDKETEISDNEFYGCTNLKKVKIGNGVVTIGDWAFSGCSSLDYFKFGEKVETIGKEAFSDCIAVTRIISRAATPPICGSQALDDLNKWACTLEVPKGTLPAYQEANQWMEFFFVEEGTPVSKKEDLDSNGAVDESDVTLLINNILGKDNTLTGLKGDVNNDGDVDIIDVTTLINDILEKK